jgi:hypothetical protein
MKAEELLPCCLCNGRGVVRSIDPRHRRNYRFKCTQCGLSNERLYASKEEAAEAWNCLHSPKLRTIDGFTLPDGYTIVPSNLFKEAVEIIKTINVALYRKLVRYNIWHYNVKCDPPGLDNNNNHISNGTI